MSFVSLLEDIISKIDEQLPKMEEFNKQASKNIDIEEFLELRKKCAGILRKLGSYHEKDYEDLFNEHLRLITAFTSLRNEFDLIQSELISLSKDKTENEEINSLLKRINNYHHKQKEKLKNSLRIQKEEYGRMQNYYNESSNHLEKVFREEIANLKLKHLTFCKTILNKLNRSKDKPNSEMKEIKTILMQHIEKENSF